MKKLRRFSMPQPGTSRFRSPRTRFETAAELLRLEFESARLSNEIETNELRNNMFSRRLVRTRKTIRQNLLYLIEGSDK